MQSTGNSGFWVSPEGRQQKKANTVGDTVKGVAEPFTSVVSGIKELVSPLGASIPKIGKKREGKKGDDVQEVLEKDALRAELKLSIYQTYKNYKKMHSMLTW